MCYSDFPISIVCIILLYYSMKQSETVDFQNNWQPSWEAHAHAGVKIILANVGAGEHWCGSYKSKSYIPFTLQKGLFPF